MRQVLSRFRERPEQRVVEAKLLPLIYAWVDPFGRDARKLRETGFTRVALYTAIRTLRESLANIRQQPLEAEED